MRNRVGSGFTIVELLIVIVVIAILAAITIVAYNGIQAQARDSQRKSDVASIAKALELYYIKNGQYPGSPHQTGGSDSINSGWSTTADASWQRFVDALKPYASGIGKDPTSTVDANVTLRDGYNYAYFASASDYCGAAPYQMYILVYRLEGSQVQTLQGDCSGSSQLNYGTGVSNYRVVK